MSDDPKKYPVDIDHLRELEFGDRSEAIVRLISVSVAGVLIHLYTGWISALVWPVHFAIAWTLHTYYVFTRESLCTRLEIAIATLLSGHLQIAFGWLPMSMFIAEPRELTMVGAALLCAQMVFLVRRNDPLLSYMYMQIATVILGSVVAYVGFLPVLQTPLALLGAALALIGLNYYFVQSLRVTRRMRLTRELSERQAHQAMKMAAVGQLAGGVAHDFNNNLTAIGGSLELAKLTDDRLQRDMIIDNALVASRQAARTVEKLMIFARSETPEVTKLWVSEVFLELETLTERLIPTSIEFQVKSADQPLTIVANRNQLLSALVNLVTNSIDAMPKGGVLKLKSDITRLPKPMPMLDGSNLEAGAYVQITLEDNGEGIPDSILMEVANPFFTTKPVGKGTGLGLSMVSGMMTERNGGIAIHSNRQGTKVTLFFPTADPSAPNK